MFEWELQTAQSQTYEKKIAVERAKLLGNAFIDSQFNSAPLIWMSVRKLFILRLKRYITRRLELFTSQMQLIMIC